MARRLGILFVLFSWGFINSAKAAPITWIAHTPNSDLNSPVNWSPSTVPDIGDVAIFNSAISGIDTTPFASSAPFSVFTFQFPNSASVFHYQFNNQPLIFHGTGLTGTNKNPTIHITNSNNSSFIDQLLLFSGATGTAGSAAITSANSATLTGSLSGTTLGIIGANCDVSGPFTIADGGTMTMTNTGIDQATGTGNNGVAHIALNQLHFAQSLNAANDVTISAANSGTFSGTNSAQGDIVGRINGSQWSSSGAFHAGENFTCEIQNSGNNSNLGIGNSNVGVINSAQMLLHNTGTVGSQCQITISNTGVNSSQTTGAPDFVAYLNDEQFCATNLFQAADDFTLTVTNTGTDISTGYGQDQVAVINSNSGTTGEQILLQQGCSLGDRATINAANSGVYSGTNTAGGPQVALMNLQQMAFGDSTLIDSYAFHAGDDFLLSASNSGIDSSHGTGSNAVGSVSSNQATFYAPGSIGDRGNFTLTNSGNFSGQATLHYVNVGSVGVSQLNILSTFLAGDDLTLDVTNSGNLSGSGAGGNYVGDVIFGQQVAYIQGLETGDRASITISNTGTNSSSTTSNNQVGSLMGYGKQLLIQETFQTGDDLQITITNSGLDESTVAGGNFVGFINNNTADGTASQLHLDDGGTVGDRAAIALSNTGTYQGNNSGTNSTGVLAGQQMYSVAAFHAGDDLSLMASNSGANQGSSQSNNGVGLVGASQVRFGDLCVFGQNASVTLTNSGINLDTTGTGNTIGYVGGAQFEVGGNFTGGKNLLISATNSRTNLGDGSNVVGQIAGSQLVFSQSCSLDAGSQIIASNAGSVTGSQIVFGQGFTVLNGKALIQATNSGVLSSFGIDIQGSNAGGNADIVLSNNSLYIEATSPAFTIASLSGDAASLVQSNPTLVINTDASTHAEFLGVIQDFPEVTSTLNKTGPGVQKLSGINTYTGLTTIDEGVLIISGSLNGPGLVNASGTLKGGGSIAGTLTNFGTIAPGESIDTLSPVNFVNNGGVYDAEVNGLGLSDLIHASGTATLNGGSVIVSTTDLIFLFYHPYTIVTADGGLLGAGYSGATSAAIITPILSSDANNVYLTILPAFDSIAHTCNQSGVANILNQMAGVGLQNQLLGAIANLPLDAAEKALESLSGFQYTNEAWLAQITARRFLRTLYDPLRSEIIHCNQYPCNHACSDWTFWIEPAFGTLKLHGDNTHETRAHRFQLSGGVQKDFCSGLTLGLAGSYEYDPVDYTAGTGKRYSEFAGAYGLYRSKIVYGLIDLVYGHTSDHVTREILAGNLQYTAEGQPILNTFTSYCEVGFNGNVPYMCFQPFVGIEYGKNWRSHISETQDNDLGLSIRAQDWSSTSSRLGLHISSCNLGDTVDLSLDVAWNQLLSSRNNATKGRFQALGDPYTICGNDFDNYSIDYALTILSCFCSSINGYFQVSGESWSHAHTLGVLGGFEISW